MHEVSGYIVRTGTFTRSSRSDADAETADCDLLFQHQLLPYHQELFQALAVEAGDLRLLCPFLEA